MNNDFDKFDKEGKFLKHQHSWHKSVYFFFYSLGTFCLLTAWAAFTYHNHPTVLVQGTVSALSTAAIVSGCFLVIYGLAVGWEKIFWRRELSKKIYRPFNRLAICLAAGYLLVGICLVFVVFSFHLNAQKCDDMKCFMAMANNCDDVILKTKDQYGLEWSYYTSGCKLQKELIAIDDGESIHMKAALEGKSLTCVYTKGKFNERWVNSVMDDLETCTGDLRDAIGKLLLFF